MKDPQSRTPNGFGGTCSGVKLNGTCRARSPAAATQPREKADYADFCKSSVLGSTVGQILRRYSKLLTPRLIWSPSLVLTSFEIGEKLGGSVGVRSL
jgi:hypothetical protein